MEVDGNSFRITEIRRTAERGHLTGELRISLDCFNRAMQRIQVECAIYELARTEDALALEVSECVARSIRERNEEGSLETTALAIIPPRPRLGHCPICGEGFRLDPSGRCMEEDCDFSEA